FKDKVIVSIDAKNGLVMIKGWKSEGKGVLSLDFANALKETGFKEVIYTDTSKDGTLLGPNIKDTKEILKKTGLKVIASGGISSLDDIIKLQKLKNDGLSGIIIGKALYEGKFTLSQAIKIA
ncbi:MAG: HisA/HisF-related TIM barrel protein, partial [Candidatus Omnitrophica bacterium]|nr:HisA/HisF-related TIM barrel protein [Candidatus Omnitrophota bacterium]